MLKGLQRFSFGSADSQSPKDDRSIPNIAILIPQMRNGGAERAASRLYRYLEDKCEVSVVVFEADTVGYGMEGKVTNLGLAPDKDAPVLDRAARSLRRAWRYRRFKNENRIEVTYSFGDTANIVSVLSGGRDKKISSIRGFARLRVGRRDPEALLLKAMLKLITMASDRVVVVSELMRRALISEYRVPPAKVVAIHNGYDVEQIEEASKAGSLPGELQGARYIASVGTLRTVKRFDHLLRAFAASGVDDYVQLVIVGDDPRGMRADLLDLAERLGIGSQVKVLPFMDNPHALMAGAEVFVLPSESEGFPNVLVEALALGLPSVSTDCKSGPREILAPETDVSLTARSAERAEYGYLVPPPVGAYDTKRLNPNESERSMGVTISDLLADDIARTAASDSARARAAQFDIKTWGQKHIVLFKAAARKGK